MEGDKAELDMSKKPEQEVAVFGFGVLFKKFDRLIELQDRTNFLLAKIEQKVEKLIKE